MQKKNKTVAQEPAENKKQREAYGQFKNEIKWQSKKQ